MAEFESSPENDLVFGAMQKRILLGLADGLSLADLAAHYKAEEVLVRRMALALEEKGYLREDAKPSRKGLEAIEGFNTTETVK
jgi:hypothetical protein